MAVTRTTRLTRTAVLTTAAALAVAAALTIGAAGAWASHHEKNEGLPRTDSPDGAEVYIISPKSGDTLYRPVTVRFGLRGMGVAPAGTDKANTGHHHLIIDSPLPPMDLPIPADDKHIHFGGGQTEVKLDLEPGKHTLQLVLGDMLHIPHRPSVVSKQITITVR